MYEIIWLANVNIFSIYCMAICFNPHNNSALQTSPIFLPRYSIALSSKFFSLSRKSVFLLSTYLTTLARQGQSRVARPGQKSDVPLSACSWETDFSVGARLWNGAGGWNTVTPSSRKQLSMTGRWRGRNTVNAYRWVSSQDGFIVEVGIAWNRITGCPQSWSSVCKLKPRKQQLN